MNDRRDEDDAADGQSFHQIPHVPGLDPRGTGLPRKLGDVLKPPSKGPSEPAPRSAQTEPSGDEDAPLGGSEVTEEQLTADTAVEQDALKAFDPDDTPV
ncbi:hypothetical protein [Microbacterium sp. H1-D42]|uniref:hypothetical protein n=1 Tax=Microbacterium sp. H1-D42 TaxID=2925844 RepID=UPI001F536B84|nr:hypothetical protein [Microbacterium sp. H1-D42]UNK71333.1 hypothetical protein MNR00_02440 [Microbacterium sp. H1-D42]